MGIENRVALITGSASGMGKQTAQRMAENGAKIVINDLFAEKVKETVDELKAAGHQAIGCVADVTDKQAVENMCKEVATQFGGIDILVNNAGHGEGRCPKKTYGGGLGSYNRCESQGYFSLQSGRTRLHGGKEIWADYQHLLQGMAGWARAGALRFGQVGPRWPDQNSCVRTGTQRDHR